MSCHTKSFDAIIIIIERNTMANQYNNCHLENLIVICIRRVGEPRRATTDSAVRVLVFRVSCLRFARSVRAFIFVS